MRVIIKHRHKKGCDNVVDAINVYVPKPATKLVEVLRELWEREYNSWDPEPDRELSWFEDSHARLENELYITEFMITNAIDVER
jgi:hypothetical protein